MNPYRRIGAAALIAAAGVGVSAGDLDPPAAPAPSPGPEPRIAINAQNTPGNGEAHFVITEPGSYYLAANILNAEMGSDRDGILIAANGVTLDLNGFTLDGSGATLPVTGILASDGMMNLTIRNGAVQGWSDAGIDGSGADNCRTENIIASGNSAEGIFAGDNSVITGCVARGNGQFGVRTLNASVVTGCTARENSVSGFLVGSAGIVTDCTAFQNGNGFQVGEGSTVSGCSARSNTGDGILSNANGSTIRGCTLRGNTGNGISVNAGALILENNCSFNGLGLGDGAGIRAGSTGCRIEGNSVISNDRGIEVGNLGGCYIIRNTAQGNTTNYDIGTGNATGTIVTATTAITAIAPWANFEF